MRIALAVGPVLAITVGIAHADPWSEYRTGEPPAPLARLTETCEIEIEFRGAVVDVELRQRLTNTSTVPVAATRDFSLPAGARLVGFAFRRGNGALEPAVSVVKPTSTERVTNEQ